MTEISAADSGTGMSEEDEFPIIPPPMKPIYSMPHVHNSLPNYRNGMSGAGYHALPRQPGSLRKSDVIEPDQFYEIRGGTSQQTPKIVVNTRQKSKYRPQQFNLKSPRRTLAKFKLLQSFSPGSQSSSKEGVSPKHISQGSMYVDDPVSRRSASMDSFADTTTGSLPSMNSSQTFRNSRAPPASMGTFKPEMDDKRKQSNQKAATGVQFANDGTSNPIESNI